MSLRWLKTCLLLLPLCGCATYNLERLRAAELSGDAFHKALAKGYRDFAQEREKHYNWAASWYFADKGLRAVYGKVVEPEEPSHWRLPAESRTEIESAREALMESLKQGIRDAKPQAAADAQVNFDCWVQQQEAGWRVEAIARCRDGFYAAMKQLNGQLPDYVDAQPPMVVSDSYIAYFGFNEDALSMEAKMLASEVARHYAGQHGYHITIHGHTDRAGADAYNMQLSRLRAQQFREALVAYGIERERISLFAFGETDPKVPTADDVREPINRRVEIFMNDKEETTSP